MVKVVLNWLYSYFSGDTVTTHPAVVSPSGRVNIYTVKMCYYRFRVLIKDMDFPITEHKIIHYLNHSLCLKHLKVSQIL